MQKKIKTFLIFLGTLLLCFVISSLGEKDAKADEVTTPKSENTLPTTDTNTVVNHLLKIVQQYTCLYTIKIKKKLWTI